jgi:hypothetical protein
MRTITAIAAIVFFFGMTAPSSTAGHTSPAPPLTPPSAEPVPPADLADPDAIEMYPRLPEEGEPPLPPDPRTDGRWMILTVVEIYADGEVQLAPEYNLTCWKDSHLDDLRIVPLTKAEHQRYRSHPDPRSLPCPVS